MQILHNPPNNSKGYKREVTGTARLSHYRGQALRSVSNDPVNARGESHPKKTWSVLLDKRPMIPLSSVCHTCVQTEIIARGNKRDRCFLATQKGSACDPSEKKLYDAYGYYTNPIRNVLAMWTSYSCKNAITYHAFKKETIYCV